MEHLACEVVPRVDAQLPAVVLVVPYPRVHLVRVSPVALEGAVDGPDRRAEPLRPDTVHVIHPEPERRLKRHHGVLRHLVRVPQPVEPDTLPRRSVVVVPRNLQRAAPVVLLPRDATPLLVGRVAVVAARPVGLLDVAHMPGLVRDVREEGGDLPLSGGLRTGICEAGVRAGGLQERSALVEALALASVRRGLGLDADEEFLGDDALH
uniref:Uncharacterized protein n=1 Tax=Arundo donax TaxID=35708 RepID=A0A0A9GA32_ARUDO